jgi:hypothetical protein
MELLLAALVITTSLLIASQQERPKRVPVRVRVSDRPKR